MSNNISDALYAHDLQRDANIMDAFEDVGNASDPQQHTDTNIMGAFEDVVENTPYQGGLTKYSLDKNADIRKDTVISKLVPEVVGDCPGNVCMSKHAEEKVLAVARVKSIEEAKRALTCDSEVCLLEKLKPQLGAQLVDTEIRNGTLSGPTDNSLLSNVHIDGVMSWFARRFPDFFPYNFNMRNYIDYSYVNRRVIPRPDTLATIRLLSLLNGTHNGMKYRTAGCVINDDVYQGPGTHWMALFMDARGPTVVLEFFNSSAGAPHAAWCNWMRKNKAELESSGRKVECVRVDEIRHQHSITECGVYSLFYIYSRLNGVPAKYFRENPVPDQIMFEFRQHLFGGEKGVVDGKFEWAEYKKAVNVAWE